MEATTSRTSQHDPSSATSGTFSTVSSSTSGSGSGSSSSDMSASTATALAAAQHLSSPNPIVGLGPRSIPMKSRSTPSSSSPSSSSSLGPLGGFSFQSSVSSPYPLPGQSTLTVPAKPHMPLQLTNDDIEAAIRAATDNTGNNRSVDPRSSSSSSSSSREPSRSSSSVLSASGTPASGAKMSNVGGPGLGGGDSRSVPPRDTRTQLFVGNLPYRVRWQDLKDLFRRAGTVLRADVSLGADNRSRGYGTVLLATAEDAGRAIDLFNGYEWQTRILEVRVDRIGGPGLVGVENPVNSNSNTGAPNTSVPTVTGTSLGLSPYLPPQQQLSYQQQQFLFQPRQHQQVLASPQLLDPHTLDQLGHLGQVPQLPSTRLPSPRPAPASTSQQVQDAIVQRQLQQIAQQYLPTPHHPPYSHAGVGGQAESAATSSVAASQNRDRDQPLSIPGRTLFVGNLPYHVQWQDLKDLFRRTPGGVNIVRADVALGPDGRSKGFGTITLSTSEEAERARRVFSGFDFNGRQLKVHYDRLPSTFSPSVTNIHLSQPESPYTRTSPQLATIGARTSTVLPYPSMLRQPTTTQEHLASQSPGPSLRHSHARGLSSSNLRIARTGVEELVDVTPMPISHSTSAPATSASTGTRPRLSRPTHISLPPPSLRVDLDRSLGSGSGYEGEGEGEEGEGYYGLTEPKQQQQQPQQHQHQSHLRQLLHGPRQFGSRSSPSPGPHSDKQHRRRRQRQVVGASDSESEHELHEVGVGEGEGDTYQDRVDTLTRRLSGFSVDARSSITHDNQGDSNGLYPVGGGPGGTQSAVESGRSSANMSWRSLPTGVGDQSMVEGDQYGKGQDQDSGRPVSTTGSTTSASESIGALSGSGSVSASSSVRSIHEKEEKKEKENQREQGREKDRYHPGPIELPPPPPPLSIVPRLASNVPGSNPLLGAFGGEGLFQSHVFGQGKRSESSSEEHGQAGEAYDDYDPGMPTVTAQKKSFITEPEQPASTTSNLAQSSSPNLPVITPSMPPFTFVGERGEGEASPSRPQQQQSHFQMRLKRQTQAQEKPKESKMPQLRLPPPPQMFQPQMYAPFVVSPVVITPPIPGHPMPYVHPLGSPGSPYALGPHHPLYHQQHRHTQSFGGGGGVYMSAAHPHPLSQSFGSEGGRVALTPGHTIDPNMHHGMMAPFGTMSPGATWGRPEDMDPGMNQMNLAVGAPVYPMAAAPGSSGIEFGGGYPIKEEPKGYFDQVYENPVQFGVDQNALGANIRQNEDRRIAEEKAIEKGEERNKSIQREIMKGGSA